MAIMTSCLALSLLLALLPATSGYALGVQHVSASRTAPRRLAPPAMEEWRQPQYVTDAQQRLLAEERDGDAGSVIDKVKALAGPLQPWVDEYAAQPTLAAADAAGLVLFALGSRLTAGESVLNPFGDVSTALPFLLAYFLAAKPLDAYADGVASKGYAAALQATAPAWAAGTLGGVALRALGTFSAPDVGTTLLTFISTAVFLGGARAAAVYKETGELPDLDAITSKLGGD